MGPGVGLPDVQVGEQGRDRLGGHRASTVGMDGQLAFRDGPLARHHARDPVPHDLRLLALHHDRAGAVAAEDVEHHEQVIPDAPGRTPQRRGVIRPHPVGRIRHQLGYGPRWVGRLSPALADLAVRPEQPVHRRLRGEVGALIEQGRPRLGGSPVHEALGVEDVITAARSCADSALGGVCLGFGGPASGGRSRR